MFKSIVFYAFFALSFLFSDVNGKVGIVSMNPIVSSQKVLASGNGTIVVVDIILRATSADSNDPVVKIEIFDALGNKVKEELDCGLPQCETSINGLSSGDYSVVAHRNSGLTFSDTIQVK